MNPFLDCTYVHCPSLFPLNSFTSSSLARYGAFSTWLRGTDDCMYHGTSRSTGPFFQAQQAEQGKFLITVQSLRAAPVAQNRLLVGEVCPRRFALSIWSLPSESYVTFLRPPSELLSREDGKSYTAKGHIIWILMTLKEVYKTKHFLLATTFPSS